MWPCIYRRFCYYPRVCSAVTPARGCGSFHLDARCFDDRPPLLDLGLMVSTKRFRCLLLGWIDLLPDVGEPLAHGRIGKAFDNGFIEFADDVFWRAFRNPHPVPNRQVELW